MGIIQIEPASLSGMRFLFSFYGLSETGKTLSALRVAAGLEPDPRKRMLLDTEGGQRGRAYVNEINGGYLYASLSPPYTPERYIQALNEIEAAGVSVLVTDSASHSWFAEGGVLAMVEESTLKNDMAKWKDPKRRLGKMMQRYRSSDMHHILCSRAKQPMIEGEVNGRKTYVPGPVVPIQEKMMRYDMTVIAQMLGRGAFTLETPQGKCPGNLLPIFQGSPVMNEETGHRLAAWINVRAALSPEARALRVQAAEVAALGLGAYGEFWAKIGGVGQRVLQADHDNLKSIAKTADDERARGEGDAEREEQAERERADPNLDDPFGGNGIEPVGGLARDGTKTLQHPLTGDTVTVSTHTGRIVATEAASGPPAPGIEFHVTGPDGVVATFSSGPAAAKAMLAVIEAAAQVSVRCLDDAWGDNQGLVVRLAPNNTDALSDHYDRLREELMDRDMASRSPGERVASEAVPPSAKPPEPKQANSAPAAAAPAASQQASPGDRAERPTAGSDLGRPATGRGGDPHEDRHAAADPETADYPRAGAEPAGNADRRAGAPPVGVLAANGEGSAGSIPATGPETPVDQATEHQDFAIAPPLRNGKPDLRTWSIALFLPKLRRQRNSTDLALLLGDNADTIEACKAPGALGKDDLADLNQSIADQWKLVGNG